MAKINDVRNSLVNCQNTLQKHLDDVIMDVPIEDENLKLREEYFEWIDLKTKLISSEKEFILPYNALPNKINEYIYNYLYQDKKNIVDKYYKRDGIAGEFIINAKKNKHTTRWSRDTYT